MSPRLDAFDHVHVFVADRAAAVGWYRQVLGLEPLAGLAHWAANGGPLTLGNPGGDIHIALFERDVRPCRSTVALRVAGAEYPRWKQHLQQRLSGAVTEEDHGDSRSLYFSDPDGNPYEITTYDVAEL